VFIWNVTYYPSRLGVIRSELGRNIADLQSKPSNCLPGSTTLLISSPGSFSRFLLWAFLYPTPQGALTQLWAGTSPDTADLNGAVGTYYLPTSDEAHTVCCSILVHGRGFSSLATTIHSLGENSGFGSKSRLRISDYPQTRSSPNLTVSNFTSASCYLYFDKNHQREWLFRKRDHRNKYVKMDVSSPNPASMYLDVHPLLHRSKTGARAGQTWRAQIS